MKDLAIEIGCFEELMVLSFTISEVFILTLRTVAPDVDLFFQDHISISVQHFGDLIKDLFDLIDSKQS